MERHNNIPLRVAAPLKNATDGTKHESSRTTKLYDRTDDEISLDEIEKVVI